MCVREPKIEVQYGHWTIIGLRPVIFGLKGTALLFTEQAIGEGEQKSLVQVLAVLGGDGQGWQLILCERGNAPMHEEYPTWILSRGRILGRNRDNISFLPCYSQVTSSNKNLNEIVRS